MTMLLPPKFRTRLTNQPVRIEVARFIVGGVFDYPVYQCDEVKKDGKAVLALWRFNPRSIETRNDLSHEEWLQNVKHELLHAWRYHFPEPSNRELLTDWKASVSIWFMKECERQNITVSSAGSSI